jgi:hypothetical protein
MQMNTRNGELEFESETVGDKIFLCFTKYPDVWFNISDIKIGDPVPESDETQVHYNLEGKTPEMEEHFSEEFMADVGLFLETAIVETVERLVEEHKNVTSEEETEED